MARRQRRTQAFGLSLLDLLSCAFGGVIMLAVIFGAMMNARRLIEQRSFFFVDCTLEITDWNGLEEQREEIRAALSKLDLSVQISGPGWSGEWIAGQSLHQREASPGIETSFSSSVQDIPSDSIYTTLLAERAPIGLYDLTIALASPPAGARRRLGDRSLTLRVELHRPGASESLETSWILNKKFQPLLPPLFHRSFMLELEG